LAQLRNWKSPDVTEAGVPIAHTSVVARLPLLLLAVAFIFVVAYPIQRELRRFPPNAPALVFNPPDTILLKDKAILECSGLELSLRNQGSFWLHNDSGDSPRLFLVDKNGETRLRLHVTGAEAIDWEDLSIGEIHGQSMLIVGDIGGNARQRDEIMLYLVIEPQIDLVQKNAITDSQQTPSMAIRVRVPGGVTNYESIGFDSTDSSILLIEKSALGGRVYSIEVPNEDPSEKGIERLVDAKLISRSTVPTATACDVSDDGSKLIAINYFAGFLYERKMINGQLEPWLNALQREPKSFTLPKLRQAESVCFSDNNQSIYVSSEFAPTPIIKVDLRDSLFE
jgi:hypothetical protein